MTSGALAAWQAWLLIGTAAALAAGLFLLKLRPPRTVVPSLLLWRRVLDESRNLTLWERIRRAVSLVVTILIAVLLALAAVRPSRAPGSAGTSSRMLIVIDSLLSMHARTPGGSTRWDRAISEARQLIGGAAGSAIAVATTADGIVEGPTGDATLLEAALDRIAPAAGDPGAWPRLAGGGTVHFITDGATARPMERDTLVHSVFEPAPNAAITAFEVRPPLSGDRAGEAYLEVANYAPAAQKIRIRLTRGTTGIFDGTVDVGASALLRQVVPLARDGHPALRATIDAPDDALELDDEAVAWIERATPLDVIVVGAQPAWLRTALAQSPDVRASFVNPAAYPGGEDPAVREADVLIFDGWAPPEPPPRPALLFAPPADTAWLLGPAPVPQPPVEERQPRWTSPGEHRVVRGVDPFTLVIERARAFGTTHLQPIARSARGTPLVYAGETAGRRMVVLTFGSDASNLPSAPGFPVLLANALDWLTRPDGGTRRPGVAALDASIERVIGPDGSPIPLVRAAGRVLAPLRTPGFYVVEAGGARGTLAVNAGDPQHSNLTRSISTASADARPAAATGTSRPWWVYCAWAAFLLGVAEWWTWQRRITV